MPIPLRLRKRRDGTLALRAADNSIDSDERAFPDEHLFLFTWLVGDGSDVAHVEGDVVGLELVNARAVYRVTERQPQGLRATLEAFELRDPTPIDEDKAAEISERIAAERRATDLAAARALIAQSEEA